MRFMPAEQVQEYTEQDYDGKYKGKYKNRH